MYINNNLYVLCKYNGCKKKLFIGKYYCRSYKYILNNCYNEIYLNAQLITKKFSQNKYLCVNHKIWNFEDHLKYHVNFQIEIMTLLLVSKRYEIETKIEVNNKTGSLRIPKFVKFEIFKRALCL